MCFTQMKVIYWTCSSMKNTIWSILLHNGNCFRRHCISFNHFSYRKISCLSWFLQLTHTQPQNKMVQYAVRDSYLSATNLSQQWCLSKQCPNTMITRGQVDSRWWQETEKSQVWLAKHLHNQTKTTVQETFRQQWCLFIMCSNILWCVSICRRQRKKMRSCWSFQKNFMMSRVQPGKQRDFPFFFFYKVFIANTFQQVWYLTSPFSTLQSI